MRPFAGHPPFAAGLALLLALAASGCRSTSPAPSQCPPLRIGVSADSPPLIYRQKGHWAGVEADLGRALATRLGRRPVFVGCAPDRLADALLGGKVDLLMAGMAVTEERRVQMDFSAPYLVVGQAALVRTGDLPRCNTPIKIRSAKVRVGVIDGSAGDRLVSSYFPNAIRTPFPDADQAADALRHDRIELFIHAAPAVWWLALRHEPHLAVAPPLFAKEEIAWAFRRSSVALREDANRALADWQKDGTLESILRRWIPVSR